MLGTFADDIELPAGGRVVVRVVVSGRRIDFCDSDALGPRNARFGLTFEGVRDAVRSALEHVGDDAAFDVVVDDDSWVGGGTSHDRMGAAMGKARVFDAVLGALAQIWPDRVGAGSTSLGAMVELRSDGETHFEVVPGGEGATPDRAGRHAWVGPILPLSAGAWPDWLEMEEHSRTGSGGGGARRGGDGVVRTYRLLRPAIVHVGIDRRGNPPHGIDRAGPPEPARLCIVHANGDERSLAAWTDTEVPAHHQLRIETAGGAGHGFPGYGEITWDPKDYFD